MPIKRHLLVQKTEKGEQTAKNDILQSQNPPSSETSPAPAKKASSSPVQKPKPSVKDDPPTNKQQSSSPSSSTPHKSQSAHPAAKVIPAPIPASKTTSETKSSTAKPPPKISAGSTSGAHPAQAQSNKILGMDPGLLIEIGIIATVSIILIFIIVTIYRRYKTRKDYNESPQNFPHKPSLGLKEQYHLNDCKVQACLTPESITIQQKNEVAGKSWRVQFRGTQKSAIYFHRRQNTTTYYQIELLSVHGSVQMGYVPVNCFDKIKSGEESIGNSGVGVTNAGYVQAEGENLYNYGWTLIYGDVFGMGLTRQNSKFSQRRAWISKNGVLLNTPPNEELGRWLATIDISAQQKAEFNLGTENKEEEPSQGAEGQEDEQKIKAKAQRQKIEGLLKKQRISLKTFNPFEYYPVIYFYGNKDDSKSTVININVGGQIFRMFDTKFRSGLLKDKALFGDD